MKKKIVYMPNPKTDIDLHYKITIHKILSTKILN